MNRLTTSIAAALFCMTAGLAYAQSPSGGPGQGPGGMGPGGHHGMMQPCSQTADPAKCEADRKKAREDLHAAREACKGNADPRGCMTQQFCGKQANPAQCQERAKERHAHASQRMDQHQAVAEACTGKRGDDLQKCYQEQRQKRGAPVTK
jgi:Spy/CpxP family protein refolding chaperone